MAKRILVTSTDLMMVQFLLPHIINLSENGYEVEIACSVVGGRIDEIREKLNGYIKKIHTVRLVRSPLNPIIFKGYGDVKRIIENGSYDIIWTNEPVMGVTVRLAAQKARKAGTKVMYMVHGFHFYKGAPLLNWMVYYPIERIMASKADLITTINREDYKRAQSFNVKRVEYIHGIGINTDRLTRSENAVNLRSELGLAEDDFIVISVGELNKNKNQKVIIKAIAQLNDPQIHYVLCGKGDQLDNLKKLIKKCSIESNVHFLGYRKDVVDICSQADVFAMPSKREGLPVASLEAMYCGLPLVNSNIRGLEDVTENGKSGFTCEPEDASAFAEGIRELKENVSFRKEAASNNFETVKKYCVSETKNEVIDILNSL